MDFLLLASQRKTELAIDRIAQALGLDEWDALERTTAAESRLATDAVFALQFEQFLDSCDGDARKQACTVQETRAMTHQEIAAVMGISWQRVQQLEKRALRKLRKNPETMEALRELLEA